MRAQLIPLDGTPPIEIAKEMTLVGRKEECDVLLNHKSVSKMHCVIVKTDGMLLLRDLGSTNGTRVNGQRIRRAALLPNDQLTIACFKFRVHFGAQEAPVAPPPPHDHTQHLDPKEVANLLRKAERPAAAASASNYSPAPPLHPNPLPDIYPDDPAKQ
jgi:pSer/pThr/pTyr-binding forkhead associated (FHA) protein